MDWSARYLTNYIDAFIAGNDIKKAVYLFVEKHMILGVQMVKRIYREIGISNRGLWIALSNISIQNKGCFVGTKKSWFHMSITIDKKIVNGIFKKIKGVFFKNKCNGAIGDARMVYYGMNNGGLFS